VNSTRSRSSRPFPHVIDTSGVGQPAPDRASACDSGLLWALSVGDVSGRANASLGPRPVKWCRSDHLVIHHYQLAAASSGTTSFCSMTATCTAFNDSALR
jgi:hypothetical protein